MLPPLDRISHVVSPHTMHMKTPMADLSGGAPLLHDGYVAASAAPTRGNTNGMWLGVLALGAALAMKACSGGTPPPAPASVNAAAVSDPGTTTSAANGWHENYQEALRLAKEQKKPVLISFQGSDWCGWCKRVDAEVFSSPQFKAYADKNLILLNVDFPHQTQQTQALAQQNSQLQSMYGVSGFPTTIVVNADGKPLQTISGYVPLDSYMSQIQTPQ